MWYVCNVLYVRVNCFVVCGCAVSRRSINVCNSGVFGIVNNVPGLFVLCFNGRRYVCCSECYAVSNEHVEPTTCLVQHIGEHGGKVMYFGGMNLVS